MEVWAGMRGTSSSRYLQQPELKFAVLDLSDPEKLRTQLRAYRSEMGGAWDYVVHAAGATKCIDEKDFFRTNTDGTRHLVEALRDEDMVPQRFIFVSSLSIFGAVREEQVRHATEDNPWVYSPILDTDTPRPNTAYGRSKLQAEEYLRSLHDFPYVILRPTGVYGPRERDYFLMAQSIQQHVDFAVGYKRQEITFVYVMDVVQAVMKAMTAPDAVGKAFFLSDGEVYNSRQFSDLIQQELGNPWVFHIKAPLWILRIVCAISGTVCHWLGRLTTLNLDKYHILSQRNWQCDITPARQILGFDPQYQLSQGVHDTIAWYKQEGWL